MICPAGFSRGIILPGVEDDPGMIFIEISGVINPLFPAAIFYFVLRG